MDRLTRTILITGIIILYHSSVFPEEADYSPIAKNTVTLNLQTELRQESKFSTWGWMWKANQEPGRLMLGGISASFFPKEGAEIGVRYMRPSDAGMRDTVVMSYGERYKWKRINGDSFEIFSRVYFSGKKNHFFSGILGAGRLSSIQYSYQREFPDGMIWKKSEMENLVRENFPFSPPGLPDTADIFLSSRVYTSAGIGYLYAFGSLRINVDLEIKMPFKESRKVLVNSDPKYFVNSPAYSLPEVYARQILISGSYSSETFWWPILSVALFAPLKFLVPVYHYENKGIHISSASGKEKTVDHSIKSELCFGILVFNCAFFEGFESGISANRRLKEEIYPALLEDYLVRTGKIPERK